MEVSNASAVRVIPSDLTRIPYSGDDQCQSCHGTHNDGIHHGTKHGHQAFAYRFIGLCGPVGHGRGTDPGLIGEGSPSNPGNDQCPQRSAQNRLGSKSIIEDECKTGEDPVRPGEDDIENTDHVEHHHDRHHTTRYLPDPLDPSEDHRPHNQADQQSG